MARFDLGLVAAALAALLTLGATFGDPSQGADPGPRAELSDLTWTLGEDTRLFAPSAQLDLEQRTALTSLRGTVHGTDVEVRTLRLGAPETNFEQLRAHGSLVERALKDIHIERLDVREAEASRLGEVPRGQGEEPGSASPNAGSLSLQVARGGLRLSVSGVGWLEGLTLTNRRGDTLTIETVSIPLGGEEWTCDGVSLTQGGVEKKFERLHFVVAELKLLEPQTLMGVFKARPPELALDLGSWE